MDVFIPIVIFVLVFLLFSICGFCCKRKRQGTVYGHTTNVTVTGQPISASPVVVPPYPIDARHPLPQQAAPPAPGFATHNPPYPTHTPHPVPASLYYPPPVGSTPYPPAGGAPYHSVAGNTPYPPAPMTGTAPYPDYSTHPPSYSEAVAQPPLPPVTTKEGYSKQAPYNPNY